MARSLRVCFEPDVLFPLGTRRLDARCTSSKLLSRKLKLQGKVMNYRQVGVELGVTRRTVAVLMGRGLQTLWATSIRRGKLPLEGKNETWENSR